MNDRKETDFTTFPNTGRTNWDKLYREQAPRLKGVCRRYVGNETTAEDLVQESFITAIDKFGTYNNRGSLEGWIRKIAVNKCLLYLREKHETIPVDAISTPEIQESAMENSQNKIRCAIERASFSTNELLEVVDNLPAHHKTVFNLYVIDGFSHKQIAQMLSISLGTSKSHLARARKKAQELLYAKAVEQPQQETQRRYLPFLLLFSPNYIERIFKKGFANYQLPVGTSTASFPSLAVSGLKWGATLAGKCIVGGAIVSAAAIGYLVLKQDAETPKELIFETNGTVRPDSTAERKPDTLLLEKVKINTAAAIDVSKPDTVTQSAQPKKKKDPVIIRKTIVVHDTIRLEKPVSE
jgi:RNA polymerase sigma factor (sigma-70 family)